MVQLSTEACERKKIKPSITVIVVGKRHHVRFFPMNEREADRSGNCRAGTVVDGDIVHPIELDFYLQSHGGLLGTSRPAHYNVLHDDVGFSFVHFVYRGAHLLTFGLGPTHCKPFVSRSATFTRGAHARCRSQRRSTVCPLSWDFPHFTD